MAAGELYWSAIAPIWETASVFSSPDAFLSQFARVTEAQGLVLAARWCLSETLNGGFHQFFFNPTGVLAPEGVRGFKLLGIPDAASVVTAAMAKLGAAYPREQEVRRMHLGRISPRGTVGAASDPFDVLDRALQATTMDFVERADAFVRAHMALFFRSGAWRYFTHPDGRTWAIRQAPDGFELGIGGADPDDLPILRARRSCNPERDTEALVADAIADGFVPRPFFVP